MSGVPVSEPDWTDSTAGGRPHWRRLHAACLRRRRRTMARWQLVKNLCTGRPGHRALLHDLRLRGRHRTSVQPYRRGRVYQSAELAHLEFRSRSCASDRLISLSTPMRRFNSSPLAGASMEAFGELSWQEDPNTLRQVGRGAGMLGPGRRASPRSPRRTDEHRDTEGTWLDTGISISEVGRGRPYDSCSPVWTMTAVAASDSRASCSPVSAGRNRR